MPATFSMENGKVRCSLCPHACLIADRHFGVCGVCGNENGSLSLPFSGLLSATSVDPIEKKPLYHFYPGKTILSVGFYGCNLKCPFCQNYHISQQVIDNIARTQPHQLVDLAISERSFGIAYTYSEPLVHYEYVLEASRRARRKGLKNVLVTNGYINPKQAKALIEVTDAANVDLKSFKEDFYRKELGGSLEPVLEFIRIAAASVSLEVTTLVIPGKSDSDAEIDEIAAFLSDLDPNIPLHLSCYYPTYKYTIGPTAPERVFRLVDVAKKRLNYVYAGNVGNRATDTLCPHCSHLLISRRGYAVTVHDIADGKCGNCGASIPIAGV